MKSKKKFKCDKCKIHTTISVEEEEIEGVEFNILRMDKCGHGFVVSCVDGPARVKKEKVEAVLRNLMALHGSGDLTGAQRLEKKHRAAVLAYQDSMRRAWNKYSHLVDEVDPAPALRDDT